MLWLNIVGIAMLVLTAVMHLRAVRKRKAMEPETVESAIIRKTKARVIRGPVPGYARYEGEAVVKSAIDALTGEVLPDWTVVQFETFHAQNRPRGLLRVRFAEKDPARSAQIMTRLAVGTQRASGLGVVSVERAAEDGRPTGFVIYSPDRRGWHGVPTPMEVIGRMDGVGPVTARVFQAPGMPPSENLLLA